MKLTTHKIHIIIGNEKGGKRYDYFRTDESDR